MSLRHRMGFDAGSMRLEEALAWAARHGLHCSLAFGSPEEKLAGRDYLAACWSEA